MKFLMYSDKTSTEARVGIVSNSEDETPHVVNLSSLSGKFPLTLDMLVKNLEEVMIPLHDLVQSYSGEILPLNTVKIHPPFSKPGKILCVGLNYRDHVLEGGRELPRFPTIFTKATTAIIGDRDPILLPTRSQQVDFEAELAVVIGKLARNVTRKHAMEYVAGYTILNDVTARDYQNRSSQWTVGKSFDTFAPMGPFFITPDEIPDPHQLEIQSHLNGIEMQHSNTSNLIFNIPYLIEDLSAVMTLEPGDIISTGTPSGVGVFRDPPVFLQPSDRIDITIQGLGTLSNDVKKDNG